MSSVSVVIPVYNVKSTLEKCVESIINQTLKDIEIILVDDGSTDGSEVICDEYAQKDSRIKVLHLKNGGYGRAVNSGIKAATGDYIGIVESDDYAELNMYEDLLKIIQKDGSDFVKSNWFNWEFKKNKNTPQNAISENCVTNACEQPELLQIQPTVWSALYRKDFLINNDIWFLETPGASYQDVAFSFKAAAAASKISLTTNAYIHYRIDNDFSSVKSKDKVYAICGEYEEIERFLKQKNIVDSKIIDKKFITQWDAYLWNLHRISSEMTEDFIEKMASDFYQYYFSGQLSADFLNNFKKENAESIFGSVDEIKKYLRKKIQRKLRKETRRKFVSLRCNKREIYLKLFGIEILNIKKDYKG